MTDENNKSDYNKPFMDLKKYTPEPYLSDVNISLFSNLFNRFLTKQEIVKVFGYIGRGNKNALISRQIKENTVHRQAFQLQPILNNKIGSIQHMAAWKDIQNELERLGVDIEDFANWGSTQKFNWVPPIDINKLINYKDYYWTENSPPQYITVRSRCATATSKFNFWQTIIDQYGSTFPIVNILEIDDTSNLPVYPIVTIDSINGFIKIIGDATNDFTKDDLFDVVNTISNDNTYKITTVPTYDGVTNTTELTVNGLVFNENVGLVKLRRYDKIVFGANDIVLDGDYSNLFEEGFILFLRNFNNIELNNTFVKVVSSVADVKNTNTTVIIELVVTDNTFAGGEGSLEEQQNIFSADMSCQCGVSGGWDDFLWDDNPDDPLWGDTENAAGSPISDGISDHENLLNRINNPGPPTTPGKQNDLWNDTLNDVLYQYDIIIGWTIIWNNFSLLLEATDGSALWDLVPSCDTISRIKGMDQWVKENKWLHKNDITNFAGKIRASLPIIEYDWDIELNEWTYIDYKWSYKAETDDIFEETENNPPIIELEPITWWELVGSNTILLDYRYGNLTEYFTPSKQVYISDGSATNIHEVDYSEYKSSSTNDLQYRTYVTFKSPPNSTGDLDNLKPNTFKIYPLKTEAGDAWQGYDVHWLFLGAKDAVPVPHQVDNQYIAIDQGTPSIPFSPPGSPTSVIYEYTTSLYAQNYLVKSPSPGRKVFELINNIPIPSDTRSLRQKALFGFDDIRVYLSDTTGEDPVRQFGNYDEIGEAVLDVFGVDIINNEFIVTDNNQQYFNSGDIIRLYGNTGIGTQDFVVQSNQNVNRIEIVSTGSPSVGIPINTTTDGQIINITNPLSTNTYPNAGFVNTKDITLYVMGIKFFNYIQADLNITIEVGAASMNELGNTYNKVRKIENQEQFLISGNEPISQIEYRRVEQVKTKVNQYPLFDIFTVEGNPAYKTNPIFGYKTSPEFEVKIGFRIVYDSIHDIYEFDQFLLDEDNGELFSYRDYNNKQTDFWYNPETKILNFWKGTEWDERTQMSNQYRKAVVSNIEPSVRERAIDGLYWFDTELNILKKRFIDNTTTIWNEISPIDVFVTDINLQTIWKSGLNNELYIPDKVDWERRSQIEYDNEKNEFITSRVADLLAKDPSLTLPKATIIAEQEWFDKQSSDLSPNGMWIGDWEIPDPLYFNHLHENRKYLTSRELLTHFTTIINQQPVIPGYNGTLDGMFNLIPFKDVNYGFGGTIKEFNNGFDSMLSSTFVNNVTPRSLIEFAHDQYEGLLNSLKEIYRKDSIELLTNVEINNILNLSSFVSNEVIKKYELNDQNAFIYGDTTTFTDVDGVNDLGVRNWIATLPYVNLINKHVPERIINEQLSLNEIVHHDSHRNGYSLTSAAVDIISQLITLSPDSRVSSGTMGKSSTNSPPNNITEFIAEFDTQISNREGVYWYYTPTTSSNILYRYVVAESGINIPPSLYPDGTLWMDLKTGLEVLRNKKTDFQGIVTWDVVKGLAIGDSKLHNGTDPSDVTTATISAWQIINLDILLGDTIFDLETKLYNNVPSFPKLAYDFENTTLQNTIKYTKYLEEAFLDYVSQSNISTPYLNSEFSITDAFTWNYKRSVSGGGFNIIKADGLTNSFVVSGNTFSLNKFFVKNSDINDGTWNTITIIPNLVDNTTSIFVDGDVLDSTKGVIYSGLLPSFSNDGSESGGDWRDLYTKMYGTPYPHIEPWILQGYVGKPDWWDEEYLNDDINQWGDRKWKYKHGFPITAADNDGIDNVGSPGSPYGTFSIDGNFYNSFVSGEDFHIDNSLDHAGTYTVGNHDTINGISDGIAGTASIGINNPNMVAEDTYFPGTLIGIVDSSNVIIKNYTIKTAITGNPFTIGVEEEIVSGDISIGNFINGALYDPSTNSTKIKIQGNVSSNNVTGRIIKLGGFGFGMWENIRSGVIPPGKTYPNGVVSISGNPNTEMLNGLSVPILRTFNYFSVNISNDSINLGTGTPEYKPDYIFPPYWDYKIIYSSTPAVLSFDVYLDPMIRSIYDNFSSEIISPNANYVFGDSGNVEWEWKTSSQFLYDQLTISYRIDPVRYVSSTFGFNFTEIGELQIDRDTKNTPSHVRVNFHGDVVDDKQFKSNGLNQWYVNFNRYLGYDSNFSDFRELWTGWKAPLTYQFASFIDTPSLSVTHRFVNITNFDYNITSKRAPGVDDYWLDAFKIIITNIPYNLARYDTQLDWRFDIKTNINISRNIKYYDVHNYQFYANTGNDECWLYTWEIVNIDTFNKTFTVSGNQKYVFSEARQFNIIGSTGNDGIYDVITSSYDSVSNTTLIKINNNIFSPVKDGLLKANYREIPWKTGDIVYLSTAETLPIPLISDTINGLTKYFIIKESNTTFKLAETPQDALTNTAIDITSSGRRDQFVGEILNIFVTDKSNTNWRFYAIDKTNILELNTPFEVQGMQVLVDTIHGYDVYTDEQGWKINSDKLQLDPDSSKIINWRVEIERFITYAYTIRIIKEQVSERYPVTVDATTSVWTFSDKNKSLITGDVINVTSSNSVYPTPLSPGIRYYIIRDNLENFRLAATTQDAIDGIAIIIISTVGVGNLQLSIPKNFKTLIPEFEINPFRNSIWIQPSRGIISNIVAGPVEDIRTTPSIFDQNGNQIKEDQLRVYRQDKETKIQVVDAVNTIKPVINLIDPSYTLLNLGGLHLFVDTYEHAMVLNNYTSENNLLYDPFIGLNVTKYEMLFNKQPEFTHRPNVSGYYLETFFNQGADLKENIEASIENLRFAYDTYNTLETNLMTQYSRKGLGYEGTTEYLNNLNLSRKSQFLFWMGQIQNKGSVNAVDAFINSRRFIDAKIDDFWAVKIGEFGSVSEKEFPEMYVTTVDARSNELRLEFINNDVDETDITQFEESFTPIKMSNQDRWYNQPDQIKVLRDNGKIMYFDLKPKNKFDAIISGTFSDIINNNSKDYIRHDLDSDTVEITQYNNVTSKTDTLEEGNDYNVINNNIIEFIQGSGSPLAPNLNNIIIWGMVLNNDAQNPARIIDRNSETQISPIQFWDPARGIHYSNAIHNIDLQNDIDPAKYNNTSQTVTYSGIYPEIWKDSFVGTSWLNTENLDYVTYYSKEMIPDTTERFRSWGQLADWSEVEIFEWVESDIPPNEWDALAQNEEGDRTIIEHLRKSGTARKILLEKSGIDWVHAVNKFEEQYVATEATLNSNNYDFIIPLANFKTTGSPLQYFVNVYVNGKLFLSDILIGSDGDLDGTYSISTIDTKESDVVRFVQLVTTDQTVIDAEVINGNMLQEYEYTQVPFYNELGNIFFKYYFWVDNKKTKPTGRNRTMPTLEAEIQLVSIPSAHMFFQNIVKEPNTSPTDDIIIPRSDLYTGIANPVGSYVYSLQPISTNLEDTLVEVNGLNLPSDGIAYIISGSPLQVTILNTGSVDITTNNEVKISYSVIYNKPIMLPTRFTQAIVRGLQGIVNADKRYTIRFTRNFTLRDNLDVENENVGSIDLKNLHEEWKIFRQEQQYNIDRWQWDKITESIVEYKLTDPSIRVPSYERELYDEKFGTDTRYGLDNDQAFVSGVLALSTILSYLSDPNVDFSPIDINIFFTSNSFDTPENIIKSMDEIYNSFTFTSVNRIFFSVLNDAFTTKSKYPGLFKTSMISLHGIKPFQTGGIFDDF